MDDKISYRRLSGEYPSSGGRASSNGIGLQRTRSVRASFRLLGSRWRAAQSQHEEPIITTPPEIIKNELAPPGEIVLINCNKKFEKQYPNKLKSEHFLKAKQKKLKSSQSTGRIVTTKENWHPMAMPEYVPPKAAAILQIPTTLNSEQFNRNTQAFLLNGSQFRFLKRSVSLNTDCNTNTIKSFQKNSNAKDSTQRTATIRRGSVWANSTISM